MARVLVVDDDPRLVKVVANLLRKHEFQVESVPNGELGRQALRRGDIDLALLDVNLPDVNGLSLIFQLREEGNTTPIILLTVRTEVHEQALGLRLGGDDYIVKPFNPEVLLARIDAVLRRSAPSTPSRTETPRNEHLEIPPVTIDLTARLAYKDGMPVRLAPLEYAVLEFLAVNRGRAVSKEELMLSVWGTSRGVSRTLAEHISRLRRKLGDDLIMTQTGYGYLIPAPPGDRATTTQ
ncbi:response regulator transcription factor [Actinomadura madurae]|uniref:response regulator transcription factor n=1 Tax=Actinomadura madurae TaxID=1993 RepID=UPI0020268D92|nr:response regulator transcription factor [Actinomadura madurae]MCP9980965.1 response regulator transcription factor [Actinomadura madurae]MCQ0007533.1 response regulator transcription factor [Actinomadura madurae]MCQ0017161.1 response regulator transcription factor [Actinomadura madurae]URM97226.1 response regulator transcription factor [Actinomadura madurae]